MEPKLVSPDVSWVAGGTDCGACGTADDHLRMLGIHPPTRPGSGCRLSPLRDRQVQVVLAVAAGHSSAEAGELLYISVDTVKSHLRTAMNATGLRRRALLGAWFARHFAEHPPPRGWTLFPGCRRHLARMDAPILHRAEGR